jgi:hypothetical protein
VICSFLRVRPPSHQIEALKAALDKLDERIQSLLYQHDRFVNTA